MNPDIMQIHNNSLDHIETLKTVLTLLQSSATLLSFKQFMDMSRRITLALVRRAETEPSFVAKEYLKALSHIIEHFDCGLQVQARVLLLQLALEKTPDADSFAKLNKVKHIVFGTPFQYLLLKSFIVQAKFYKFINNKEEREKILQKCVVLSENYLLQNIKAEKEIRQQIVDQTIIVHFQLHHIYQKNRAQEHIRKAFQIGLTNYGADNPTTLLLKKYCSQNHLTHRNNKIELGAFGHNNCSVMAYYISQEECIRVDVNSYNGPIKSTVAKMKLTPIEIEALQKNCQKWISIVNGVPTILKEEMFSRNEEEQIVNIRNISRDEIFKKEASSSSDQEGSTFFDREEFKFLTSLRKT